MPSVSDKVPSRQHHKGHNDDGSKVLSNLPLQMALHFNIFFAPVWIVVVVTFLADTFVCYDVFYKYITVTVAVSVSVIEVFRLYLGNEGNFNDKIPELTGFYLLSLILQLPLQSCILLHPYFRLQITEVVVQSLMLLLLIVQIISSYFALKHTRTQQELYSKVTNLTRKGVNKSPDIKKK